MKSYGSVAPGALRRAPSAIDVYADDDASPPLAIPRNDGLSTSDIGEDPATSNSNNNNTQSSHTVTPLPTGLAAWSSWWSVMFFSWCDYLSAVCAERPLRLEDIWALDKSSTSLIAMQVYKNKVDSARCVIRAFYYTQSGVLFFSGLLTLASVACELVMPIAVFYVVDAAGNNGFESLWSRGTLWTAVLLIARFLRWFLLGWADFILNYALVRTLSPLNMLLLESVLTGSRYRRTKQDNDEATNLFATDMKNVASVIKVIHRLWSLPLELVGLFYVFDFLFSDVITGIFVVCGFIYLLIQLLNIKEASLLKELLRISDKRFGELHGIFDQILGVKLNAWQDRVLQSVEAIRVDENRVMMRHVKVRTIRMALTWAAPSLNLVATGIFIAYLPNHTLQSPAQTFAVVTVFHGVNSAFTELLSVLRECLAFRVSLERIEGVVPVACSTPINAPFDFITRITSGTCVVPVAEDSTGNGVSRLSNGDAPADHDAVVLSSASYSDPANTEGGSLLDYVSLRVKRGEFVVVHGKVGSGKSLLLAAIAGLLHRKRGKEQVVGSIAYCSQSPWIQSTTVRENVLFGRTFDAVRYWSVLSACELLPDIQSLPRGDQTLVGSRSYVSLSSGQQSRIALARACYADADIYVLDSPLDSVDSIVQCDILLKCMGRLLQHKTIILASHNPEIIMSEYVDRTLRMDNMELVAPTVTPQPRSRVSSTSNRSENERPTAPGPSVKTVFVSKRCRLLAESDSLGRQRRRSSSAAASTDTTRPTGLVLDPSECLRPQVLQIQAASARMKTVSVYPVESSSSPAAESSALLPVTGRKRRASASTVHASPYRERGWMGVVREYLSHTQSPWRLCLVTGLHFLTQVLATGSIYCFSRWMSQYAILRRVNPTMTSGEAFMASKAAFHAYVALVIASAVSFLVAAYATFAFSRGISDRLFRALTNSLLHARMSFFAETTVGKLLNRYCRDLQAVDSSLQDCVFALLKTFFGGYCALFASLGWMSGHLLKSDIGMGTGATETSELVSAGLAPSSSVGLWLTIMVVNVILTSSILGGVWYVSISSNRPCSELFLMNREALSPIFTFVSESIAGRSVIRAFGADQRERITVRFSELLDHLTRITWAIWCFESWLAMRSLLMENFITGVLLVGLICFGHDADDPLRPATIGLLLLLIMNLRDDLKNVSLHWNALEKDLVCLQRVFEYIHLEPEIAANPELPPALVDPVLWPRNGSLSFTNVDFQYSPYVIPGHQSYQQHQLASLTPLNLRDVNFQVQRGEKIGIVGRSGAGKSSLAMALLRVNNPTRGLITLDGVDITLVDLDVLRAKVSYLPPNPVFCSGTVRDYLDPFTGVDSRSMDDFTLWSVLGKTGLKASIRRVPRQLDASLEDIVYSWSNGERQLLCLARALLLRARVIFLDEATTATDQETDFSVQSVVVQSLEPDMTLLCISHRIDAVLKLDKLLVISDGRVDGFGTVSELVASGDGEFFDLLESAQLVY